MSKRIATLTKDEPGFTRVVPIKELRAKDGNLSISLFVGGGNAGANGYRPRSLNEVATLKLKSKFNFELPL